MVAFWEPGNWVTFMAVSISYDNMTAICTIFTIFWHSLLVTGKKHPLGKMNALNDHVKNVITLNPDM